MTCIIGLKTENNVYIGADSSILMGFIRVKARSKIQRLHNGCLIGFVGTKSTQNLMEERAEEISKLVDTKSWNQIWRILCECTPNGYDSEILIATQKDLIWVGNVGSWRHVVEDFVCIGNGGQIATGAMAISADNPDHEQRILKSLDIASQYCTGVNEPFYIRGVK